VRLPVKDEIAAWSCLILHRNGKKLDGVQEPDLDDTNSIIWSAALFDVRSINMPGRETPSA
jgi:hypothetical protein